MSATVAYNVNRSSSAQIAAHLLHIDAAFQPALSSRVDIHAYAQKLHDRAVRFEAWVVDELVGLVATYCNQLDWDKAFVSSVSVWPQCQGQGIAGELMRQCIDHVRGIGFGQMELEVDQRSLPAVALYQKFGFKTLRSSGASLTMGMRFIR